MSEEHYFTEDSPEALAVAAEFEHHLSRVGVAWGEASGSIFELAPTTETVISDEEIELRVALDIGAMLEVLQSLPDGAGTAAFLAGFG